MTGRQPVGDGRIPMAYGTGVVEAAGAEVTELKPGDHVAPGQTGLAAGVADLVDTSGVTPMSPALSALAVTAFAIGTTEFVMIGLVPDIARDLTVTRTVGFQPVKARTRHMWSKSTPLK